MTISYKTIKPPSETKVIERLEHDLDYFSCQHAFHQTGCLRQNVVLENSSDESLRQKIIHELQKHFGTSETNKDNFGAEIAKYLRSEKFDGKVTGKEGPEGLSWCGGFVSYILEQVDPSLIEYSLLAKNILLQFANHGAFYGIEEGYTPLPGDIIFLKRGDSGWTGHIGFVATVIEKGGVITIEGNKLHPDYKGVEPAEWNPLKPDGVYEGVYHEKDFHKKGVLGFGCVTQLLESQRKHEIIGPSQIFA